jgi:hypothetical protein
MVPIRRLFAKSSIPKNQPVSVLEEEYYIAIVMFLLRFMLLSRHDGIVPVKEF